MKINEIKTEIQSSGTMGMDLVNELSRLESLLKEIMPGLSQGIFCRSPRTAEDDLDGLFLEVLGAAITKRQIVELEKFIGD